ncbi:unnamed protein product [Mytilus coruscus]|uniref:IgGFc-binding protein N-terminal domain-containing protein n=1 Tax=Mytilus coruscus TaxID=42192 RepID=A0A6J8BF30_MYTCO|nr:unnamed protein product [Mytilus coruscus]
MMEENDCTGPNCEQTISMPLLDNMEATLKADLDVRKLNKFLKRYISHEVKTEIADAMPDAMLKMMNESLLKVESLESRLDELMTKKEIKEDMAPTTSSAPINEICLDTREDCQNLNRDSNICESNDDDRRDACRMTCGYCEPMGHTFYLGFSPNIRTAQLIFSSVRRGVCNLTTLGSSTYAHILLENASRIHSLSGVASKEYKLKCNILTKLYVIEIRSDGVDGYIVIPTKYLSRQYIIPSYNQGSGPGTYLAIISTNQATEVEISQKGKSFTKASLNIDMEWNNYNNDKIDISGSYVEASKPVAVFSNIVCTSVGSCAPFSDMVIPMRYYSKTFFVPFFQGITLKSVRIYANSTCSINVYDASLNLLSAASLDIIKRFVEVNNTNMASIVSSCPSMVQLYSHKASNQKDFMTLITGIDKYLPHYYFTMPSYSSLLLIIIETAKKSALIIDGTTITPGRITEIQEPVNSYNKYSMFTFTISQGRHEAKTTNGASFGLWIYGTKDGFAFPAGYRISKT